MNGMVEAWEQAAPTVCTLRSSTISIHSINVSLIFPPQHSDMNEEMRVEAMELCVTACEKHSNNNEASVALIYVCKVPKSCFL